MTQHSGNKGKVAGGDDKATSEGGAAGKAPQEAPNTESGKSDKKGERETIDRLSQSLKKVYQVTIDETVPDEMMDLLKKLG